MSHQIIDALFGTNILVSVLHHCHSQRSVHTLKAGIRQQKPHSVRSFLVSSEHQSPIATDWTSTVAHSRNRERGMAIPSFHQRIILWPGFNFRNGDRQTWRSSFVLRIVDVGTRDEWITFFPETRDSDRQPTYRRIPYTNWKTRSSDRRKKEFEANPWTNQSTNQSRLEYYLYVQSTWFLYHDRICRSASVSEKKKKKTDQSICTKSCDISNGLTHPWFHPWFHSQPGFVSYFDPFSISKATHCHQQRWYQNWHFLNFILSLIVRIRVAETEPERNDQSCSFFEAFTFHYSTPSILHTKLE